MACKGQVASWTPGRYRATPPKRKIMATKKKSKRHVRRRVARQQKKSDAKQDGMSATKRSWGDGKAK